MKNLMVILFLTLDVCLAQLHNSLLPLVDPLSPQATPVKCYHCDNHAGRFPECLSAPVTCHKDEVCSIVYSLSQKTIKCQKSSDCAKDIAHPTAECVEGGYQIQPGQCELCCSSNDCLDSVVNKIVATHNTGLLCPSTCSHLNASCLHTGTHCAHDQFCELFRNDHNVVTGTCKNIHELQKCHDDQSNHACPGNPHVHNCVYGCCTTSTCLASHFSPHLPTTTHAPSTTAFKAPTVECRICTGNDCDQGGFSVLCSDGYCMENVTYHSDGSKFVTKGCSSLNDCQTYWKQNPNIIQQQCLVMMTSLSPATSDMTCRYCCNSYHCNEQMTPQNVLLFE
ncbi:uncharacterized protein LOC106060178 [Biomphalaria glabrata]|uniref:Uncharacterized protein LOC106060178 n=1 Tax=Biomphalaria glabrata TaxID=6526 RepID=A0A9W3BE19_BIOGL|nr:uncharacterized protein LOC106060178 [Biomphalaria glabrata]